ncbi:N-6 DNA methylase [Asaia sp. BMEF1]|uniref:HsdM family class I SAM-dependent methyltransferase n=1 Tax=Asaia sp. BMEF1 TaxID=3155932 RepID=UPI003F672C49
MTAKFLWILGNESQTHPGCDRGRELHMVAPMTPLMDNLTEFGADGDNLHLFDQAAPSLLAYTTILAARATDADMRLVEAVYEWGETPLMYLVDGTRLDAEPSRIERVRRILAMRGDAPYLGVIQPGRLDVFRIALDNHPLSKVRIKVGTPDERWSTFARLGNLRPSAKLQDRTWISGVILRLLDQAISALITQAGLTGEDAISLVGRALFLRFLADRNLLPASSEILAENPEIAAVPLAEYELLDRPELITLSCGWLDRTFNGDLLPLSSGAITRLTPQTCFVLGNILRRADGGQLALGWKEDWGQLDFSHIPVGVLSQAYEYYLRKHAPDQQEVEGGFYTPHPIANLMVSAAFRGLAVNGDPAHARILDPASGAGVFLLASFRELVAARWRVDGKRPGTPELREILYGQIRGFDVNEAALRFSALGLYLLSIELDPDPRPVDKLHFTDLRGKVLFRPVSAEDDQRPDSRPLGSLGPLIGTEHDGRYDLVIGNPPWSSATGLEHWSDVLSEVHAIARQRLGEDAVAPPLPNAVLDLPFVWRAMRWAKPDAQIVLALHARLLFQQGDGMPQARQSIIDALDVTSIINGSEVRQSRVWPSIAAPFCILLAVNRPAHAASGFRMITPRLELGFNDAGMMRVDAGNAHIVRPDDVRGRPETLKILFRGSEADLSLIDRMRLGAFTRLGRYWRGLGEAGLAHGNGYQQLRPSSRKVDGVIVGQDARHLQGQPNLDASVRVGTLVDVATLPPFTADRLHRVRNSAIYDGPVLLIHQSPPVLTKRLAVAVCDDPLVYNESWYGFSAACADNGELLTRYLALVLGSQITLWILLVTSGKFGFEREVVEKAILEEVAILPLEHLDANQRNDVVRLFAQLEGEGASAWPDIDAWVATLYGLGERDLAVIADTLEYHLPYKEHREKAEAEPSPPQIALFSEALEDELGAFAARFDRKVKVSLREGLNASPWRALDICVAGKRERELPRGVLTESNLHLTIVADRVGASEIVVDEGPRQLCLMLLAQGRYWSKTQARLCAQRLVWSRAGLFKA